MLGAEVCALTQLRIMMGDKTAASVLCTTSYSHLCLACRRQSCAQPCPRQPRRPGDGSRRATPRALSSTACAIERHGGKPSGPWAGP